MPPRWATLGNAWKMRAVKGQRRSDLRAEVENRRADP
jgi:hypothetical protein